MGLGALCGRKDSKVQSAKVLRANHKILSGLPGAKIYSKHALYADR